MNPIEHLWLHLKELIYKLNPELDLITNNKIQKERLCEVLPRAWEQILVETIEACLNSMKSRLQAVIDAEGWHTKYWQKTIYLKWKGKVSAIQSIDNHLNPTNIDNVMTASVDKLLTSLSAKTPLCHDLGHNTVALGTSLYLAMLWRS